MKSAFRFLLILMLCSFVQAYVITFDDLPLDVTYDAGDSPINSDGVQIILSGPGSVTVRDDMLAGGLNNELWINAIALDFNFSIVPLCGLSFQYGYYGGISSGTTNFLQINNIPQTFDDFSTLHGMNFNGATVSVTQTDDGVQGAVIVIGEVNSFILGGQQLVLDNVIACIPEPATLALFGLGALALVRRKK